MLADSDRVVRTRRPGASRRWPEGFKARVSRLRRRCVEKGLDGFLITCPTDIRYLSGFSGEDSWALVTGRGFAVLSDRRFEQELAEHVRFARAVMRKKSLAEELGRLVKAAKIRRLGCQAEHLSVAGRRAMLKHIPARMLKETSGWLLEQRSTKDADEIKLIRGAVDIQERALGEALKEIRPGMTEKHACAILEFQLKRLGADGPSFATIIAAGANSSIPHYRPGEAKIRAKSPVLIDFGAYSRGYCSDMTRVVGFGGLPSKIREIYQIVHEAQMAGIEAIRPGATLKEVDGAARKVIRKAGYAKHFGHGLGHGIGLEIHEEPRVSQRAEGELRPGHVVTVEPGIYLPGVGGVRIEDDVVVTDRGGENLCSLPKDIESAIIR